MAFDQRPNDAAAPDLAGTDAAPLTTEMMLRFIEVAPDAVIVSDAGGCIVFVNQQAVQSFGYARSEMLGLNIDSLLPDALRERHTNHRASFYRHPRLRPMGMGLALFARRKDGTEFPVEISLSPLETSGGQQVIGIIRDITARKQLEDELLNSRREADRLKDEFIAIAAHELRNPLAALRGFADMLQVQTARGHGPALAEWQVEAIEAIDQSSARLADLTDDLLDVTRLQAGKLLLHLTQLDLVALVRGVVTRLGATTQRHTITLTADQEPILAMLDAPRFEQVVVNLVHNAIKYSPDGGSIVVTITTEADTIRLGVTDSGIGIPLADQARLFTRFGRADNARAIGGTGLGLYLCRELVERHQGRIGFTSVEGQGSTFWVVLPLAASDDEATHQGV